MKSYEQVLADLCTLKDEKFREFNERIVNIASGSSIGVRTPLLRDYAKKMVKEEWFDFEALFAFPNVPFEMRLLKCLCVGYSKQPYEMLVHNIARCVPLIDGWAVCDLFVSTLKTLKKHRTEFLPEVEKYAADKTEFSQRFALIVLLSCYMEEEYLPVIFRILDGADTRYYYTHMGAAWLLAEVLVRFYDAGVKYLKEGGLDGRTKNKAIQKARESYRLEDVQKNYLKSLKNG